MKIKAIASPLPLLSVRCGVLCTILSFIVGACSTSAIGSNSDDDPVAANRDDARQNSAQLSVPAQFFNASEAIAMEFESRRAVGALSGDWLRAWSATETARTATNVASLISAIRQSESASQLLARDGATIEQYMRAFVPIVGELESHEQAETLDSVLLGLYAPFKAIAARLDSPDAENTRSSTFCCKVIDQRIYDATGNALECQEFHTIGVLARFKCAHVSLAYPLTNVYGSLATHSCASDPECDDSANGPPLSSPGITVTAQSSYPGYDPQKAADGDTNTIVGPDFGWANGDIYTPDGLLPQWIQFDFGADRTINGVRLFTSAGFEISNYDIQSWTGTGWQTEVNVVGNTNVQRNSTFNVPVTTRLIRVLGYRGPSAQPQYVRVNELQVF